MKDLVLKWMTFAAGLIYTQVQDIIGVVMLFMAFFVLDIFTGISASMVEGQGIKSRKLRWAFIKTLCYLGTFAFTLFIGVCINELEKIEYIFKVQLYFAAWTECVSNLENLMRIAPNMALWRYLHHMLTFEWVQKIPGLANYIKKREDDPTVQLPTE